MRWDSAAKLRQAMLDILLASAVPLSAYELLARLKRDMRLAPTQVYRALDSLQEEGLVHKLASRPVFVPRSAGAGNAEGAVFMVCHQCGRVEEAPSDLVARGLKRAAKARGFKAVHPIIEIAGECACCVSELSR
jgi:Fur family zinc uptake transcriptional regulator